MDSIVELTTLETWFRTFGPLVTIIVLAIVTVSLLKWKKRSNLKSTNLGKLWDQLHPDMQDAFILANNERKRLGHDKLNIALLFGAMVRLGNSDLVKYLSYLPNDALPESTVENSLEDNTLFQDNPMLTACVNDSVSSYLRASNLVNKLTPVDMFVDIGKHGRGRPIVRLREHGVDEKMLDDVASNLGITLVRRPARVW